jgi:hypothetical protein
MSTTAIQSSSAPFYVSTDGSSWKLVVCKKSVTFNGTTPVTTEDTDCGPIVGIASNQWTIDIDAVVNVTPDIGTAESYEQILKWWAAQTLLYIRWNYPDSAGTDFMHTGQAYITTLTGQVAQGAAMNFQATFSGQGAITVS